VNPPEECFDLSLDNRHINPNMKVGTLLRYATLTIPAVTAYSAAMEIVFWAKKDIVGNVNVTSQEEASERIADVSRAWNTWDSPDTDPKEVCIDDLGGLIYPLYLEECQERPMYSPVAVFPDFDIEMQHVNVTFPEYTLVVSSFSSVP
jgi:hypothetical protein